MGSAVVTVVQFHVQVQMNFPKQEDSGDARTLAQSLGFVAHWCFLPSYQDKVSVM